MALLGLFASHWGVLVGVSSFWRDPLFGWLRKTPRKAEAILCLQFFRKGIGRHVQLGEQMGWFSSGQLASPSHSRVSGLSTLLHGNRVEETFFVGHSTRSDLGCVPFWADSIGVLTGSKTSTKRNGGGGPELLLPVDTKKSAC